LFRAKFGGETVVLYAFRTMRQAVRLHAAVLDLRESGAIVNWRYHIAAALV
jgi:hypothetical protein